MPKTAAIAALLLLFACSMFLLVSGSSYLESELPGGLPLGNALSALSLCSLAGIPVLLTPPGTPCRTFSQWVLSLSVAWLPASLALAGNLSLNFHGSAGTVWLAFSLLVVALLGVALLWAVGRLVLSAWRRTGAP